MNDARSDESRATLDAVSKLPAYWREIAATFDQHVNHAAVSASLCIRKCASELEQALARSGSVGSGSVDHPATDRTE